MKVFGKLHCILSLPSHNTVRTQRLSYFRKAEPHLYPGDIRSKIMVPKTLESIVSRLDDTEYKLMPSIVEALAAFCQYGALTHSGSMSTAEKKAIRGRTRHYLTTLHHPSYYIVSSIRQWDDTTHHIGGAFCSGNTW
jgi:hypothetical protein